MTLPKASKTRTQIRQMIGRNLDAVHIGVATATGTVNSVIDDALWGGSSDHKGKEIIMLTGTVLNVGDVSIVREFNSDSKTLTFSPAIDAATASADTYELWARGTKIAEVNDKINQAIIDATDDILVDKEDHSLVKETKIYEYTIPTGFVALHTIEHETSIGIDYQIHACDAVWDESVDDEVTETLDTDYKKEGTGSLKLVVGASAEANDILITQDITSLDLSQCDELSAWVWSSAALADGAIQILLDDTADCADPVESLDVPAVAANTWTHIVEPLANPYNDSAIISVGIKLITDAANTMRFDDIRAYKKDSIVWKPLPVDFWGIVQATTNKLQLSEEGYAVIGINKKMRLKGYQIPAELSADISTCDINPAYVIARATAMMMMSHAGGRDVDPDENMRRADWWMSKSEKRLIDARTPTEMNTRWVA